MQSNRDNTWVVPEVKAVDLSTFADKVRAVAWAIVLLALVGLAIAGLILDWAWFKVALPAGLALLLSMIAPGRVQSGKSTR